MLLVRVKLTSCSSELLLPLLRAENPEHSVLKQQEHWLATLT
jgi:hypothetical protein